MSRLLLPTAAALASMIAITATPAAGAQPPESSRPATTRAAWDPSAPPSRLTDFAARINRSMVTVYCGSSIGSGWASNVSVGEDGQAAGYRTYVITNQHVIQQCTYSAGARYIEVRQGNIRYPAYVWSWDSENDLAGLRTTADLPQLDWVSVPRPLPGQWVAAFGSPFGLAGSITTGIVSYVEGSRLTSTAPINPGNSGGPLVDNRGRVLGINTASLDGSNGFGIVMGTPLMCERIVNCYESTVVWTDPQPEVDPVLVITAYRSGQGTIVVDGDSEGLNRGDKLLLQFATFNKRTRKWRSWQRVSMLTVKSDGSFGGLFNQPTRVRVRVISGGLVSNAVTVSR